ncbi:MAG: hypothetical protein KKA73_00195 [Chloroflexi bacterium]|nr:hypothetical protein [Chloroflexota bacterium]MBU1746082.1 hypothetical protein [Chloroflexota bacterium]
MTEPSKKPEGELAAEMEALARQLGATLRTAWHSQERQEIQAEIEAGLEDMSASLKRVAQEIGDSPAAQQVKAEATTYRERAREGDLGRKVQTDLTTALRTVSEQLRKLADSWTPLEPDEEPESAKESPPSV